MKRYQERGLLLLIAAATLSLARSGGAQQLDALAAAVRPYLRTQTSRVILEHVRVIDGTGAPPLIDRNITIDAGKITGISPGADLPPANGTTILDLRGYSVMPGIVGMHDHLWYLARP